MIPPLYVLVPACVGLAICWLVFPDLVVATSKAVRTVVNPENSHTSPDRSFPAYRSASKWKADAATRSRFRSTSTSRISVLALCSSANTQRQGRAGSAAITRNPRVTQCF